MSDENPSQSENSGAEPRAEKSRAKKDWRDLHLWQIQPVRDVLLFLAVLGLLKLGQMTSIVTVPVLLALLLAYLVEPVIARIMAWTKWKRPAAVGVTLAAVVLIVVLPLIGGLAYGAGQAVGLVSRVADDIHNVSASLEPPVGADGMSDEQRAEAREAAREQLRTQSGETWLWVRDKIEESDDEGSEIGKVFESVTLWLEGNVERIAQSVVGAGGEFINRVLGFAASVFGISFMAFVTAFFFYFISTGWGPVKHFLLELIPEQHEETALDLATKFDGAISGFIRGRLVIALIQAVVFTVGYMAIGVPAAFILGPAVALLSIVPYLALVGLPISVSLMALEGYTGFRGEWWWVIGAPVGFYFLGQALDDYVWTPLIQGKETGMSTPLILFATLAGGALFGVFGLLIAIPIAACLKIVIQEHFWPRFRAWAEGRAADFLPVSRE